MHSVSARQSSSLTRVEWLKLQITLLGINADELLNGVTDRETDSQSHDLNAVSAPPPDEPAVCRQISTDNDIHREDLNASDNGSFEPVQREWTEIKTSESKNPKRKSENESGVFPTAISDSDYNDIFIKRKFISPPGSPITIESQSSGSPSHGKDAAGVSQILSMEDGTCDQSGGSHMPDQGDHCKMSGRKSVPQFSSEGCCSTRQFDDMEITVEKLQLSQSHSLDNQVSVFETPLAATDIDSSLNNSVEAQVVRPSVIPFGRKDPSESYEILISNESDKRRERLSSASSKSTLLRFRPRKYSEALRELMDLVGKFKIAKYWASKTNLSVRYAQTLRRVVQETDNFIQLVRSHHVPFHRLPLSKPKAVYKQLYMCYTVVKWADMLWIARSHGLGEPTSVDRHLAALVELAEGLVWAARDGEPFASRFARLSQAGIRTGAGKCVLEIHDTIDLLILVFASLKGEYHFGYELPKSESFLMGNDYVYKTSGPAAASLAGCLNEGVPHDASGEAADLAHICHVDVLMRDILVSLWCLSSENVRERIKKGAINRNLIRGALDSVTRATAVPIHERTIPKGIPSGLITDGYVMVSSRPCPTKGLCRVNKSLFEECQRIICHFGGDFPLAGDGRSLEVSDGWYEFFVSMVPMSGLSSNVHHVESATNLRQLRKFLQQQKVAIDSACNDKALQFAIMSESIYVTFKYLSAHPKNNSRSVQPVMNAAVDLLPCYIQPMSVDDRLNEINQVLGTGHVTSSLDLVSIILLVKELLHANLSLVPLDLKTTMSNVLTAAQNELVCLKRKTRGAIASASTSVDNARSFVNGGLLFELYGELPGVVF